LADELFALKSEQQHPVGRHATSDTSCSVRVVRSNCHADPGIRRLFAACRPIDRAAMRRLTGVSMRWLGANLLSASPMPGAREVIAAAFASTPNAEWWNYAY